MITESKKEFSILIVEDELPLISALTLKLKQENFKVLQAKNGEEGLIVAFKEHPDLILLDIVMPRMDGITMLKKLREDEWGKSAKVIMLTNLSDKENVAQSLDQGAYDYLIKADWKIENVIAKVKEKLGL